MSNTLKFADLNTDNYNRKMNDLNNNNTKPDDMNSPSGFSTIDLNSQPSLFDYNKKIGVSSSEYTSFDHPFNGISAKPVANGSAANSSNTIQSFTSTATDTTNKLATKTVNTIETIKQWSKSAYKCTKQIINEKLGKTSRTIDAELESDIERLRDTKRKLESILNITRTMINHFHFFIQSQHSMSNLFMDLAQKTPELQDEYCKNAEMQRVLFKNGEILLSALNFFVANLTTLCHKTIEDTLLTIRNYEASRLEYDAYRCELETLRGATSQAPSINKAASTQRNISNNEAKLIEYEKFFELHKERYEKLRDDVSIKIKFLDENKAKVMQKQLILFHNAMAAYLSGNNTGLEATMKQFSIKLTKPISNDELKQSFLEKN